MTWHAARRVSAIALVSLLAMSSIVRAAVSVTFNAVENGIGTNVWVDGASTLGAYRGGVLQWRQDSQSAPGSLIPMWDGVSSFSTTSFASVSLGLTLNLAPGARATLLANSLAGTVGVTAADYIAELWHNHMHELANLKSASFGQRVFKDPRREFIGAFQIAAWKLAIDQGLNFDLASGRLTADSGADARLAQTWLNELQSEGTAGAKANLVALTGASATPLIVEVSSQVSVTSLVVESVPEPAPRTIWGCFVAAGLAAAIWRRKTARSQTMSQFRCTM